MRLSTYILGAASTFATANAAIKGFNYGAQFNNDQAKKLVDFEYEFNAAKNLPGTNGWTSARLYTMIQHGTQSTVIEAIQAAINTNTTLLLGMWASAGAGPFNNEITALKAAIAQYGTAFTNLVLGISVGSEDLYRITPTGIENKSGPGAQPQELINYVQQTHAAIRGTPLEGKPVGHVDTWTVYVNASNNAFISTLDFLGMDAYPYFQTTMANSISSAGQLFFDAYRATVGASQGKAVWVTETGWPVSGQTLNQAQPSAANARTYWLNVACKLVADNINFYYYTLQDVQWGNPSPSFGIKPGGDLNQVNPLFDLSCPSNRNRPPLSTVIPSIIKSSRMTVSKKTTGLGARQAPPSVKSFPTAANVLTPVPKPSTVPLELGPEFEAPDTLISFNKRNSLQTIGYTSVAQLSPDMSTIFFFDVNPNHTGKTCDVAFFVPPASPVPDVDPLKIRSPGGICVTLIDGPWPTTELAELAYRHLEPLSCVPQISRSSRYSIATVPCEGGKRVGFQVDSSGGLAADLLQMTSPPLGLFLIPT